MSKIKAHLKNSLKTKSTEINNEKGNIITSTQKSLTEAWTAYDEYRQLFDRKITAYSTATTAEQKADAAEQAQMAYDEVSNALEEYNKVAGMLSAEILSAYNLSLPSVDILSAYTLEQAANKKKIAKVLGQPLDLASDEELNEEVASIKIALEKVTAQVSTFDTNLKKFGTDFASENIGAPRDKNAIAAKAKLTKEGDAITGIFFTLKQRGEKVAQFWGNKTLTDDIKLINSISEKALAFTKLMVHGLRGKSDKQIDVSQLAKVDNMTEVKTQMLTAKVKIDDLTKANGVPSKILNAVKKAQTKFEVFSVDEPNMEKNVAGMQAELQTTHALVSSWLRDEEKGKLTGEAVKKALPILQTAQAQLQKQLNIVGALLLNKDNYPQVLKACDFANEAIAVVLAALQDSPSGDLVKAKRLDDSRTAADSAVLAFNTLADQWLTNQKELLKANEQGSGIHIRANIVKDKQRDLAMRIYGLPKDAQLALPANPYTPKEPYNADDDTFLKKIIKKHQYCQSLQSTTDYKKRYRNLGDLMELIQQWEFHNRFYSSDELKDSQLKITAADEFANADFDSVNALMSIKALLQEFDKRILGYAATVENSKGYMISFKARFGVKPDDEALKIDKSKTDPDKYFKILSQATDLQDFITNWLEQHKVAEKAIEKLPVDKQTKIEERKKYLLAKQEIIQNFNQTAITGINPKELKAAEQKVSTAKAEKAMDEKKVADLNEFIGILKKKEGDRTEEEKAKIVGLGDKKIADLEKELTQAEDSLVQKNQELVALEDAHKILKEREEDAPAAKLYKSISDTFTANMDDYTYNPNADPTIRAQIRTNIQTLLSEILNWEHMVIDPNHPNLATYKQGLESIRFELNRNMVEDGKQFPYDYKESVKLINTSFEAIKRLHTANDASKATYTEVQYCIKLIGHWRKENPIISPSAKPFATQVDTVAEYCNNLITGSFFGKLKIAESIQNYIDQLRDDIKSMRDNIAARKNEQTANEIYNISNIDVSTEFATYETTINQHISTYETKIAAIALDLDTQDEIETSKREKIIATSNAEFSKLCLNAEKALHQDLLKKEKMAFAGFGEDDLDLDNPNIPKEQIQLMQRAITQAAQRAEACLKTQGSPEEAERMMEHIPVSMWPDKFVRELNAFYETERAFTAEAEGQQDATLEEMLKPKSLLDTAVAANAQATETLSFIKDSFDTLFYETTLKDKDGNVIKDEDGDDKKAKFLGFTTPGDNKEKPKNVSDTFEALGFGAAISTAFFTGAEAVGKILTPEEKQQAADFILTGKHNETDPLKRAKADKKRIAILAGLKMSSGLMAAIAGKVKDEKSGVTDNNIASGALSSVSTLINGFLTIIDIVDDTSLPRNTQEYWNKNLDRVTKIAGAAIGFGKSVAEVVDLLSPISGQIIPGFGIAAGILSIGVDIINIAKLAYKAHQASQLIKDAKLYERELVNPLEQELHSLRKRIVKKSVDVAANVVGVAGDITTVAGEPATGTALKIIAGVLKMGNAIVFKAIDMAEMKRAQNTLDAARKGDRKAKIRIFKESPRYAKMFLAIAATRNPPSPIALEFLRQRGFTERDLQRPTASLEVVNKFLVDIRKDVRLELLSQAEERDNHDIDSSITSVKTLWKAIDVYFTKISTRRGFWSNSQDETYPRLTEIYSLPELQKLVDKYAHEVRKPGFFDKIQYKDIKQMPEYKKLSDLKNIFSTEQDAVNKGLIEFKQKLADTIQLDKTTKDKDYSTLINQHERTIAKLEKQQHDVVDFLDAVAVIDVL
jgi:hypothetical protein